MQLLYEECVASALLAAAITSAEAGSGFCFALSFLMPPSLLPQGMPTHLGIVPALAHLLQPCWCCRLSDNAAAVSDSKTQATCLVSQHKFGCSCVRACAEDGRESEVCC